MLAGLLGKQNMASRLEQLLKKQEELKAQIRKEKNKLDQAERKLDTRRKILLGSLMMDMMNKGELDEKKILKRLDGFLTKDTDRKLFDFAPHQKDERKTKIVEKSLTVEVIIEAYNSQQKIALIKAIKSLTNFELKEIKELLSTLPTSIIKVDSKEAEQIKKNLTGAGAKVLLKK